MHLDADAISDGRTLLIGSLTFRTDHLLSYPFILFYFIYFLENSFRHCRKSEIRMNLQRFYNRTSLF